MDKPPNVQGIFVGEHGRVFADNMFGISNTTFNYSAEPEARAEPESVEQFRQQLEALLRMLDSRREDIPDPADVVGTTKDAVEEIATDRPRKRVVVALLEHVASGVEAMVDLAAAVAPLVRAAGKLFH